jgi:RNA polymerase sigma-70 factor (family 1)
MAICMMPFKNDSYLLEKLKEGDEDAFNAFFKKYYKLLFANALFYTRDEQEAKDVVQDFLFEFWEKKLFLRLEGDMKGYLYRSVQHKCFNLQRKKALHQQNFLLSGFNDADTEELDEREARFVQLQEALDDLPPQRREVIKRIYLENKKYQDAADEIGITLNTLKTHLKIGLKNLREKLK